MGRCLRFVAGVVEHVVELDRVRLESRIDDILTVWRRRGSFEGDIVSSSTAMHEFPQC